MAESETRTFSGAEIPENKEELLRRARERREELLAASTETSGSDIERKKAEDNLAAFRATENDIEISAQRTKAWRMREDPSIQIALRIMRAEPELWAEIQPILMRREELIDGTVRPGERHRNFAPLFAGIGLSARARKLLNEAIDRSVAAETEYFKTELKREEMYIPEIVIGSGPHSAIYSATRMQSGVESLTIDESERIGGQFAHVEDPAYRANSRTRPESIDQRPVPGTAGNLNSMGEGTISVPDITSEAYVDQEEIAFAARVNQILSSRLVTDAELIDAEFNQDETQGEVRLTFRDKEDGRTFTVLTDQVIITSGVGEERTGFEDADEKTQQLIEAEQRVLASGGNPRILTSKQLKKRYGDEDVRFPYRDYKKVIVIGDGDSAKTDIESLLGYSGLHRDGSSMQLDRVEELDWIGQEADTKEEFERQERPRYRILGLEMPREDDPDYAYRITPNDGRATQIIEEPDGQLTVIITNEDGTTTRQTGDHIILATGYEDNTAKIFSGLALQPEKIEGAEQISAELRRALQTPGAVINYKPDSGRQRLDIIELPQELGEGVDRQNPSITYQIVTGTQSFPKTDKLDFLTDVVVEPALIESIELPPDINDYEEPQEVETIEPVELPGIQRINANDIEANAVAIANADYVTVNYNGGTSRTFYRDADGKIISSVFDASGTFVRTDQPSSDITAIFNNVLLGKADVTSVVIETSQALTSSSEPSLVEDQQAEPYTQVFYSSDQAIANADAIRAADEITVRYVDGALRRIFKDSEGNLVSETYKSTGELFFEDGPISTSEAIENLTTYLDDNILSVKIQTNPEPEPQPEVIFNRDEILARAAELSDIVGLKIVTNKGLIRIAERNEQRGYITSKGDFIEYSKEEIQDLIEINAERDGIIRIEIPAREVQKPPELDLLITRKEELQNRVEEILGAEAFTVFYGTGDIRYVIKNPDGSYVFVDYDSLGDYEGSVRSTSRAQFKTSFTDDIDTGDIASVRLARAFLPKTFTDVDSFSITRDEILTAKNVTFTFSNGGTVVEFYRDQNGAFVFSTNGEVDSSDTNGTIDFLNSCYQDARRGFVQKVEINTRAAAERVVSQPPPEPRVISRRNDKFLFATNLTAEQADGLVIDNPTYRYEFKVNDGNITLTSYNAFNNNVVEQDIPIALASVQSLVRNSNGEVRVPQSTPVAEQAPAPIITDPTEIQRFKRNITPQDIDGLSYTTIGDNVIDCIFRNGIPRVVVRNPAGNIINNLTFNNYNQFVTNFNGTDIVEIRPARPSSAETQPVAQNAPPSPEQQPPTSERRVLTDKVEINAFARSLTIDDINGIVVINEKTDSYNKFVYKVDENGNITRDSFNRDGGVRYTDDPAGISDTRDFIATVPTEVRPAVSETVTDVAEVLRRPEELLLPGTIITYSDGYTRKIVSYNAETKEARYSVKVSNEDSYGADYTGPVARVTETEDVDDITADRRTFVSLQTNPDKAQLPESGVEKQVVTNVQEVRDNPEKFLVPGAIITYTNGSARRIEGRTEIGTYKFSYKMDPYDIYVPYVGSRGITPILEDGPKGDGKGTFAKLELPPQPPPEQQPQSQERLVISGREFITQNEKILMKPGTIINYSNGTQFKINTVEKDSAGNTYYTYSAKPANESVFMISDATVDLRDLIEDIGSLKFVSLEYFGTAQDIATPAESIEVPEVVSDKSEIERRANEFSGIAGLQYIVGSTNNTAVTIIDSTAGGRQLLITTYDNAGKQLNSRTRLVSSEELAGYIRDDASEVRLPRVYTEPADFAGQLPEFVVPGAVFELTYSDASSTIFTVKIVAEDDVVVEEQLLPTGTRTPIDFVNVDSFVRNELYPIDRESAQYNPEVKVRITVPQGGAPTAERTSAQSEILRGQSEIRPRKPQLLNMPGVEYRVSNNRGTIERIRVNTIYRDGSAAVTKLRVRSGTQIRDLELNFSAQELSDTIEQALTAELPASESANTRTEQARNLTAEQLQDPATIETIRSTIGATIFEGFANAAGLPQTREYQIVDFAPGKSILVDVITKDTYGAILTSQPDTVFSQEEITEKIREADRVYLPAIAAAETTTQPRIINYEALKDPEQIAKIRNTVGAAINSIEDVSEPGDVGVEVTRIITRVNPDGSVVVNIARRDSINGTRTFSTGEAVSKSAISEKIERAVGVELPQRRVITDAQQVRANAQQLLAKGAIITYSDGSKRRIESQVNDKYATSYKPPGFAGYEAALGGLTIDELLENSPLGGSDGTFTNLEPALQTTLPAEPALRQEPEVVETVTSIDEVEQNAVELLVPGNILRFRDAELGLSEVRIDKVRYEDGGRTPFFTVSYRLNNGEWRKITGERGVYSVLSSGGAQFEGLQVMGERTTDKLEVVTRKTEIERLGSRVLDVDGVLISIDGEDFVSVYSTAPDGKLIVKRLSKETLQQIDGQDIVLDKDFEKLLYEKNIIEGKVISVELPAGKRAELLGSEPVEITNESEIKDIILAQNLPVGTEIKLASSNRLPNGAVAKVESIDEEGVITIDVNAPNGINFNTRRLKTRNEVLSFFGFDSQGNLQNPKLKALSIKFPAGQQPTGEQPVVAQPEQTSTSETVTDKAEIERRRDELLVPGTEIAFSRGDKYRVREVTSVGYLVDVIRRNTSVIPLQAAYNATNLLNSPPDEIGSTFVSLTTPPRAETQPAATRRAAITDPQEALRRADELLKPGTIIATKDGKQIRIDAINAEPPYRNTPYIVSVKQPNESEYRRANGQGSRAGILDPLVFNDNFAVLTYDEPVVSQPENQRVVTAPGEILRNIRRLLVPGAVVEYKGSGSRLKILRVRSVDGAPEYDYEFTPENEETSVLNKVPLSLIDIPRITSITLPGAGQQALPTAETLPTSRFTRLRYKTREVESISRNLENVRQNADTMLRIGTIITFKNGTKRRIEDVITEVVDSKTTITYAYSTKTKSQDSFQVEKLASTTDFDELVASNFADGRVTFESLEYMSTIRESVPAPPKPKLTVVETEALGYSEVVSDKAHIRSLSELIVRSPGSRISTSERMYTTIEIGEITRNESGLLVVNYTSISNQGTKTTDALPIIEFKNRFIFSDIVRSVKVRRDLPTELVATAPGRDPIARKVRGLPVYIAGPAAQQEVTDAERAQSSAYDNIPANAVAMFRYEEKVQELAEAMNAVSVATTEPTVATRNSLRRRVELPELIAPKKSEPTSTSEFSVEESLDKKVVNIDTLRLAIGETLRDYVWPANAPDIEVDAVAIQDGLGYNYIRYTYNSAYNMPPYSALFTDLLTDGTVALALAQRSQTTVKRKDANRAEPSDRDSVRKAKLTIPIVDGRVDVANIRVTTAKVKA